MKHITPTALLNKMNHRLNKAEKSGQTACEALLKGDIDRAERFRKRSVALRGWAKRYSNRLDAHLYSEPQI